MKKFVYIWNTEYEVLVSISTSEDRARISLVDKWKKQHASYITKTEENSIIPSFVLQGSVGEILKKDEGLLYIYSKSADIILSIEKEENTIYSHANE